MKLEKINIYNYRSIKDAELTFDHNCLILVGKNEAGKSNILKAIAGGLSQKVFPFSASDKRKSLKSEKKLMEESSIKLRFTLSEPEFNSVFSSLLKSNIKKCFTLGEKELSLKEFALNYFSSGAWVFDFDKMTSSGKYYAVEKIKYNQNIWQVVTAVDIGNGNLFTKGDLVSEQGIKALSMEQQKAHVKLLSFDDILGLFSGTLIKFIGSNIPLVQYWQYNDKYLLPSSIDINQFKTDPCSSMPLRNLFVLAGLGDIPKAFQDFKASDDDYENLLEIISEKATESFTKKWPDLKGVKIILSHNGNDITVKIQENARYKMQDRSDGFKKFFSILIMLSSPVESGTIKNNVILIDEPDNSLYPTGAKYLRDELLKIAENNLVIYSTHNPFMIDRSLIDRHILVEKKEDKTSLSRDLGCRFTEDEVLLQAIGTSSFESIKPKNLVFEGWVDYRIFNVSLKSSKANHKSLIQFFRDFGSCYSHGANSIKNLTPLLVLAQKEFVIFTDSDHGSREAKVSFAKTDHFEGKRWFTFEDLGGLKDQTIEDYIKADFLREALRSAGLDENSVETSERTPVMKLLSHAEKEKVDAFKIYIAKNVKATNIKDEYYQILSSLSEKCSESP